MYQPSDTAPRPKSFLQFLDQVSPDYIEALEEIYESDPASLSPEWGFFFEAFRLGQGERIVEQASADSTIIDELKVLEMISAYRKAAHLIADIDPLGLRKPPVPVALELTHFNLDKIPADRVFQAATELGLKPATLPEIVKHLKNTYTRKVAVEYQYIRDTKIYQWLKTRIDQNENTSPFTREDRLQFLKHLTDANTFENFLQNNYMGQKRFSIEGAEAIIPALKLSIERCADFGAEEIMIGMAHRGRLNVLVNIMQKPVEELFKEFEGAELTEGFEASGDVKYHQGFSSDTKLRNGKSIHLSLAPNPSHLEFVNPVVEGMTRAKMELRYQDDPKRIVPILIHGDAAVIGQGIVPETLNLSELKGYKTGGTIHLVINNQIGFTTNPEDSRSSFYCTDWGKAIQAPIFHVNGNDPEAVTHAIELAAESRMTFHKDAFVDIVCYRKYGHNEGDEPRFTQPAIYDLIGKMKNPLQIYREQCIANGVCTEAEADQLVQNFNQALLDRKTQVQKQRKVIELDTLKGHWKGFSQAKDQDLLSLVETPIQKAHFDKILKALHEIPSELKALPKLQKMFETRAQKIASENELDWAVGEALGFGSLLLEKFWLRLSGQDAVRGTFSHRHAGVMNTQTFQRYFPLKNLAADQGRFEVFDSPLSEAGVLGFDYGYSLAHPKALVIWEAQFGDFANGAQVIIDQFISSAEAKWGRMSGLTLLLPHGYEGQGPEHSSARLERFLQLCAQNNMQVCTPTTPAQICHVFRRQMHRNFRKPLILMSPKSLLRNPEVVSKAEDFLKGGFQTVISDPVAKAERVVLCAGKVYYDLKKRLTDKGLTDKVALVRIEQLYPLDLESLKPLQEKYSGLPWIWCQEEPKNMGAWSFMKLRFLDREWKLEYAGRPSAASPAVGSPILHARELESFLSQAVGA